MTMKMGIFIRAVSAHLLHLTQRFQPILRSIKTSSLTAVVVYVEQGRLITKPIIQKLLYTLLVTRQVQLSQRSASQGKWTQSLIIVWSSKFLALKLNQHTTSITGWTKRMSFQLSILSSTMVHLAWIKRTGDLIKHRTLHGTNWRRRISWISVMRKI